MIKYLTVCWNLTTWRREHSKLPTHRLYQVYLSQWTMSTVILVFKVLIVCLQNQPLPLPLLCRVTLNYIDQIIWISSFQECKCNETKTVGLVFLKRSMPELVSAATVSLWSGMQYHVAHWYANWRTVRAPDIDCYLLFTLSEASFRVQFENESEL
jgi:hypothetical protein